MSHDEAQMRKEIEQMYAKIQEANYYEILGMKRDAFDSSEVGGKFRQLAKKWHVDRFSGQELGEDRQKVQQIFAAINEAHRTLSHDQKREEYDAELDAGDAADVVTILESENMFLRGKNILSSGGYKGAHDIFKQAHELNPEDSKIYIYMLYTEYLMSPKGKDGKPLKITRANEIYDELLEFEKEEYEDADWLLVFIGIVALGLGKERKARRLFREALMINSKNRDAKRQMRLLDMRREREDNKGFFEKLLDKFRG